LAEAAPQGDGEGGELGVVGGGGQEGPGVGAAVGGQMAVVEEVGEVGEQVEPGIHLAGAGEQQDQDQGGGQKPRGRGAGASAFRADHDQGGEGDDGKAERQRGGDGPGGHSEAEGAPPGDERRFRR
jgi:hypothetical protein